MEKSRNDNKSQPPRTVYLNDTRNNIIYFDVSNQTKQKSELVNGTVVATNRSDITTYEEMRNAGVDTGDLDLLLDQ